MTDGNFTAFKSTYVSPTHTKALGLRTCGTDPFNGLFSQTYTRRPDRMMSVNSDVVSV
jgi:hypothetical protein